MNQFIKDNPKDLENFRSLLKKEKDRLKIAEPKDVSETLRKKANDLYKSKKHKAALELYTKSIRAADPLSELERLAFGNRSAVSYELKNYQFILKNCLKDINNATYGLEENSIGVKLKLRKADSLVYLGQHEEAGQVCRNLDKIVTDLTEPESQRLSLIKSRLLPPSHKEAVEESLTVYGDTHAHLPSASQAVTVAQSDSKGRHLKSDQEIPANSVLILEEPYVHVLLPDFWSTHCYKCLSDCDGIPVFCRLRCTVRYCSISCECVSWDKYHKYECKLLSVIVNTGIGHLSYRVITQTGYKSLIDYKKLALTSSDPLTVADTDDINLQQYDAVYRLVTNAKYIHPTDLHHYTKTALLLLLCLLDTQFFPELSSLEDTDALYVGSLLLRHIQQLICNAHAITLVKSLPGNDDCKIQDQEETKLATAIYPTASLMNHSCNPNITVSFIGSKLVVKNSVKLEVGEEIYNCYGPHYLRMEKSERQESLKSQYYFVCDCKACSSQQVSTITKAFKCIECEGPSLLTSQNTAKCSLCSQSYDASQQIQDLMTAQNMLGGAQAILEAQPSKCVELARKSRKLTQHIAYKYSLDVAKAYDFEAKCYANIGDMDSCAESLKMGISILQKIYGSDSVEVAHEYHKLAEVLCNTKSYMNALNYAKKARTTFIKQYSSSHTIVSELDILCDQIQQTL